MEFCPEVAVLQSAFYLLEQKIKCEQCMCATELPKTTRTRRPIPATYPNSRWQIDLKKMPACRGYNYVLNIVDCYSRLGFGKALKGKTAKEVAEAVIHFIYIYGAPRILQSDNGREFTNSDLEKVTKEFESIQMHGRPYHPQSQGRVERFNRTMTDYFRRTMVDDTNWVSSLDRFYYYYNNRVHKATRPQTPYQLFFRRPNFASPLNDQVPYSSLSKDERQFLESAHLDVEENDHEDLETEMSTEISDSHNAADAVVVEKECTPEAMEDTLNTAVERMPADASPVNDQHNWSPMSIPMPTLSPAVITSSQSEQSGPSSNPMCHVNEGESPFPNGPVFDPEAEPVEHEFSPAVHEYYRSMYKRRFSDPVRNTTGKENQESAGAQLADLPKQQCEEFTPIICTAVEEICAGLEQDNEVEEELLWKQRVHLLILYSLITKKYTKKQDLPKDCVPVLCTLDTLTGTIPTFSCHFYFELVKLCSWEHFFVDSFAHLSPDTAATLLQDAVHHYMHEPVSQSDVNVTMVTLENLLSHVCSSPGNTHQLLQSLASALYTNKNYIQVVFSAEPDNTKNYSIREPSTSDELIVSGQDVTDLRSQQTYTFWCLFLEKNPSFMSQMLEILCKKYPSNRIETVTSKTDLTSMIQCLGQLLLLWYTVQVTTNKTGTDSWFLYNVYNCVTETGNQASVKCMLNYPLADCITHQLSVVELLSVIHRCLLVIQKIVQKETESERFVFDNNSVIQIVPEVNVNFKVLLRMFGGSLSKSESASVAGSECQRIIHWLLNKTNSDSKSPGFRLAVTPTGDVLFGDTWERDITLSALLWRIESSQPQAEACLEELLSDKCHQFWYCDRVYDSAESVLFSTKKIMKLLRIAARLKTSAPREINLKIRVLVLARFSQLPFPDQDNVIKLKYTEMCREVPVFEVDKAFTVNTTNIFNKLTSTSDDQVVKHMFQLCLMDPVYIIQGAVERCVRNEDQAVSSAQVLQLLYNTCSCCHTVNHPNMSLITSVLHKFVTTATLNHKEEKSFLTCVTLLMQPQTDSQKAVLSPLEFLQTTLIPHTNILDFMQDDAPINFRFTLNLLNTSLSASCKNKCDWSSVDLEPVVLVVILAQVLHECVVLWDSRAEETRELPDTDGTTALRGQQLSLPERAVMRDSTSKCLDVICETMQQGYIVLPDWHWEWLLEETSCLHWSVQYRLLKLHACCGHPELAKEWDVVLDTCLKHQPLQQLASVLVLVGIGGVQQNVSMATTTLASSSIIAALAQVWPNQVLREFEHVVSFLEQLLMTDSITLVNRIPLPSSEPMGHGKSAEIGKVLGITQILSDVVMTLTWSTREDSSSHVQMLAHVVQMYVATIKAQCENVVHASLELQLYVLCQLLLHVCNVTETLPVPVSDQTWVLLLSLTSQFMTACTEDVAKSTQEMAVEGKVVNWIHCMLMAVQRLPWCEERAMIMKKLII